MEKEGLDLVICSKDDDNPFNLNEEILTKVLSQTEEPIFTISIIGERNAGKSFILNYLMKYLKSGGSRDFLKNLEQSDPLEGFIWNPRDNEKILYENQAIQIWSEIADFGKFSIIFLDIQCDGGFDKDHRILAALQTFCILGSSLTIYMATDRKDLDQIEWLSNYFEKVSYAHGFKQFGKFQILRNFYYPLLNDVNFDLVEKHMFRMLGGQEKPLNLKNLFPDKKPEGSFQGELKYMNKFDIKSFVIQFDSLLKEELAHCVKDIRPLFSSLIDKINKVFNSVSKEVISCQDKGPFESKISEILQHDYISDQQCEDQPSKEIETKSKFSSKIFEKNANSNTDFYTAKTHLESDIQIQEQITNQIVKSVNIEGTEKLMPYFRQFFLSNPGYFVISSKRSKFSEICIGKMISKYEDEKKPLIEAKCAEAIESLKPVIFALEKFTSMAENEFESNIAFEDQDLKVCLQKARKFSQNKYVEGNDSENDKFFLKCLEVLEEIYILRNEKIRQCELEISEYIYIKALAFFEEEKLSNNADLNEIIQATLGAYGASCQRKSLEKIWSKGRSELGKFVNISEEKGQLRLRAVVKSHIKQEDFKKNFEENYDNIVEKSVKIYEDEMRRMSKIPNFTELICKEVHDNCKRRAMAEFYSQVDEKSEDLDIYERKLEDGIADFYEKILRQISKEPNDINICKKYQDTIKYINGSKSKSKSINDIFGIMIGIHFGYKNIRTVYFNDSKYFKIPDENGKSVIPSCVAFENNNILFGDDALEYHKKNPHSRYCFNFLDFYDVDKNCFKKYNLQMNIILGVLLAKVKLNAENYLKRRVCGCFIGIPNSTDHHFRQDLILASQIAGFTHVEITSEAVAAGYLYAYKNDLKTSELLLITSSTKNQFDVTTLYTGISGVTVLSTSSRYRLDYLKNSGRFFTWNSAKQWWKGKLDESLIVQDAMQESNLPNFDIGIQLWDSKFPERKYLNEIFQGIRFIDNKVDHTEGVAEGSGLLAHQYTIGIISAGYLNERSKFEFSLNFNQYELELISKNQKFIQNLLSIKIDEKVENGIKILSRQIEEIEKILGNQQISSSNIYEIIQVCKSCILNINVTAIEIDTNLSRLLSSWRDVKLPTNYFENEK